MKNNLRVLKSLFFLLVTFLIISCAAKKKETRAKLSPELQSASALMKEGNLKAALEIFREEVKNNPDSFEAWRGLAETTFLKKDFIALSEISKNMSERYPSAPEAMFYRGVSLSETNFEQIRDIDRKSLGFLNKAIDGKANVGLYHAYRGIVNYRLRRIQNAVNDFSFAASNGDLDGYSALIMSQVLCWYIQDSRAAESLVQLSNRLETEFPGTSFSQESRACASMLNRKYDAAAKIYNAIIAKQPNNFNSIYDLARVHIQLDEYEKAQTLLSKVIELKNTPRKLRGKAHFLSSYASWKEEKYDAAISSIEKAIKIRPDQAHYLLFYGQLLEKKGDTIEKKRILSRLDEMESAYQWALHRLAYFFFKQGDAELSREYVMKAIGSSDQFTPSLALGEMIADNLLKDSKLAADFRSKFCAATNDETCKKASEPKKTEEKAKPAPKQEKADSKK